MTAQTDVLREKRDRALARTLGFHTFDVNAIGYDIEVLGKHPRAFDYTLALRALVGRALADNFEMHGSWKNENDLPERARSVLTGALDRPLLWAVVLQEAANPSKNRRTTDRRIESLFGKEMPDNARRLWSEIRQGAKPNWSEIAERLGVKRWKNMPEGRDIALYDHCLRVTPDPTVKNVVSRGLDAARSNLEGLPETRKQIVLTSLWGEGGERLLPIFQQDFLIYSREILDLLCSALLSDKSRAYSWDPIPENTPGFQPIVKLTDLFLDNFGLLTEDEQALASVAIMATEKCPWFWKRWDRLIEVLPALGDVADFIVRWDNNDGHARHAHTEADKRSPLERAVRSLKEPDFSKVVGALPLEYACDVAARCATFYNHATFREYGFPALIKEHPAEMAKAISPVIKNGEAHACAVAYTLDVTPDKEAKPLLAGWLRCMKDRDDLLPDRYEEDKEYLELLVKKTRHFDLALAGTKLFKTEPMFTMMRYGYILHDEDVRTENQIEIIVGERRYDWDPSFRRRFGVSAAWQDNRSARKLLCCSHDQETILWSALCSAAHGYWLNQMHKRPTEWLEEIVVPELLKHRPLMRQFCEMAWSTNLWICSADKKEPDKEPQLSYEQQGLRLARKLFCTENRMQSWLTPEERERAKYFLFHDSDMAVSQEGAVVRSILAPNDQIDLLLRRDNITPPRQDSKKGDPGRLPNPDRWTFLFEGREEKRRLVGFLTGMVKVILPDSYARWASANQLYDNPAILRQIRDMLYLPDVPKEVTDFLRAADELKQKKAA